MDLMTVVGIAAALAMDAFATAAAVIAGMPFPTYRHSFRLCWHFGLFQAGMPVLGWFGGSALSASSFNMFTRWTATGLLVLIGVKMLWEAGKNDRRQGRYDPTRGWSLVGLSLATSLDALAAGISIGLMGERIWFPATIIGLITLCLTYIGVRLGRKAGDRLGPWAERIGGVVLMVIGARILIFN